MHVDSAIVYRADIDDLFAYDVADMGEWNTEIPVSHFLDLMRDRIVPWRVEELGGVKEEDCNSWIIECGQKICVGFFLDGSVTISIHYDYASIPLHISTFTDLLALIRMLTPPSND
jgi:hypothetical protein